MTHSDDKYCVTMYSTTHCCSAPSELKCLLSSCYLQHPLRHCLRFVINSLQVLLYMCRTTSPVAIAPLQIVYNYPELCFRSYTPRSHRLLKDEAL
ncbi:hypothetical protein NP493_474g02006 [Ridgeia piscesae]|uniref:Uncharacterized protein n=1 Tax=Ridgeia piscesae TaxID=27915 RepID=A0AAD9KYP6_RIDPI|nr:hypothetical protein NP493_474g02006 [Ridgeia piscesae]